MWGFTLPLVILLPWWVVKPNQLAIKSIQNDMFFLSCMYININLLNAEIVWEESNASLHPPPPPLPPPPVSLSRDQVCVFGEVQDNYSMGCENFYWNSIQILTPTFLLYLTSTKKLFKSDTAYCVEDINW